MEYKSCASYKIKNTVFIQPYATTTDGLSQLDGPVFSAEEENILELGNNILKAIEDAGKIIPHPNQEQWKILLKESPLLKATKMKTWNTLKKKAQYVDIENITGTFNLTPSCFGGPTGNKKGFHLLTEKVITCTDLSPETLGKSLIQAFELCE
jgi:hypothetical protein